MAKGKTGEQDPGANMKWGNDAPIWPREVTEREFECEMELDDERRELGKESDDIDAIDDRRSGLDR